MAKSSADLKKQADTLRAKLAAVQKEARKMKKLEDLQATEEQHQRDIQFALEFVQMAKEMYFRDGNRSYFDYISEKMAEKQAAAQPATDLTEQQPVNQSAGYAQQI